MFLIIQTINSTFEARDDGRDYESISDARKAAISACSSIAVGEIGGGKDAISVEAALLHRDGEVAGRLVVSVSVSDLLTQPLQSTLTVLPFRTGAVPQNAKSN